MNSKAKQTDFVKIGLVLVIIAVITFAAMTLTFAKYVTNGSYADDARVAKWGFDQSISLTEDGEELFYHSYKGEVPYDASETVRREDNGKVVAPGTSNQIALNLAHVTGLAPEVMYNYFTSLGVGSPENLQWVTQLDKLPGFHWYIKTPKDYMTDKTDDIFKPQYQKKTFLELQQAFNAMTQRNIAPNTLPVGYEDQRQPNEFTAKCWIGWKWDFEYAPGDPRWDNEDTDLGNYADRVWQDPQVKDFQLTFNLYSEQCPEAVDSTEYLLTFNTKGVGVEPEPIRFRPNTTPSPEPNPQSFTPEGYEFRGWWDNEFYTGDEYKFDKPLNKDTTLWAKWEEGIHKPTFTNAFTYDETEHNAADKTVWDFDGQSFDDRLIFDGGVYTATDASTYLIGMKPTADAFWFDGGGQDTRYFEWWINKADASFTDPSAAKDQSYDMQPHKLVDPEGYAPGTQTMWYYTGFNNTEEPDISDPSWTTAIPYGTEVGTYSVWWKTTGGQNYKDSDVKGRIDVRITKAAPKYKLPVLSGAQIYDRYIDYDLINTPGDASDGQEMWYFYKQDSSVDPAKDDPNWTNDPDDLTGHVVGEYWVWVKTTGGASYEDLGVTKVGSVKIDKDSPDYIPPVLTDNDPSFSPDQSAKLIKVKGEAEDGQTLYYFTKYEDETTPSFDPENPDASWTTEASAVEGWDVGKHHVWIATNGGPSYTHLAPTYIGCVEVVKAVSTGYTAPEKTMDASWDGKDQSMIAAPGTVTGDTEHMEYIVTDSSVAPSPDVAEWSPDYNSFTRRDAGTYYIWYKVVGGKHYVGTGTLGPIQRLIGKKLAYFDEVPSGIEDLEFEVDNGQIVQQDLIDMDESASWGPHGGTVQFGIGADGKTPPTQWADVGKSPQAGNAGTYYLYYKFNITDPNYYWEGANICKTYAKIAPVDRPDGATISSERKMFTSWNGAIVRADTLVKNVPTYTGEGFTKSYAPNDDGKSDKIFSVSAQGVLTPLAGNAGDEALVKVTIKDPHGNYNDWSGTAKVEVDDWQYSVISENENTNANDSDDEANAASVAVIGFKPYKDVADNYTLEIKDTVTSAAGKSYNVAEIGASANIVPNGGVVTISKVKALKTNANATVINANAFLNLTALTAANITLANNSTEIASNSFASAIMHPSSNAIVKDSTGNHILGVGTSYSYPEVLTIDSNIKSIAANAFKPNSGNNTNTKKIVVSSKDVFVNDAAFGNFTQLENYLVKANGADDKTTYKGTPIGTSSAAAGLIYAGGNGVGAKYSSYYKYEEMSGTIGQQKLTSSSNKRYIYLTDHVTYSSPGIEKSGPIWCQSGDHVIDFNGKTVNRNSGNTAQVEGTTIYVGERFDQTSQSWTAPSGVKLRIDNTHVSDRGNITGGNTKAYGDIAFQDDYSTAGGLFVDMGCTVTMVRKVDVKDNKGLEGGGIALAGRADHSRMLDEITAKLIMYDGIISGNSASNNAHNFCGGGGVNVKTRGAFEMHGGQITNNSAYRGGGIFLIGNHNTAISSVLIDGDAKVTGNKLESGTARGIDIATCAVKDLGGTPWPPQLDIKWTKATAKEKMVDKMAWYNKVANGTRDSALYTEYNQWT